MSQWRTLIEEQQASGLSVPAFCRRAGVGESSFYRWLQRLRGEASFAEVRVRPDQAERSSPGPVGGHDAALELWLPRERCLLVRPGFDRQTLLELLALLECGT
jgi:transposase